MTQIISLIALALFVITLVVIGILSTKQSRTIDGFLLGSRKIGPWRSAFAYGTSYFSAVIFIGYAGNHGWNIGFASLWIGIGNALIGCLIAWLLLAKRTRNMTQRLSAKTMPGFFEKRYSSKNMKLYASIVIFIFLVPYSAAVYKGLGSMFNVIFPGLGIWAMMLLIAVLSSVYLVLGGYVATSKNDFVQGLVMLFGVVVMCTILIKHSSVNGITNAVNKIRELGNAEGLNLTSVYGGSNWSFLLTNILLTSFGAWGLPQMVNKYYAIKDDMAIKAATVISTLFALIIGVGAYFTGSLGRIFLNNKLPEGGFDFVVPNTLLTALGDENIFTTIVLALILLLLLSASMSTLASVVLTSASAISVDLLPGLNVKLDSKKQMLLTKFLCVLFIALSFLFATLKFSIIVNIMSFSWGVVSGCFIGPYIWGLYSKKITRAGAWAGLLSGVVVVGILAIKTTVFGGGFTAAIGDAAIYGVIAMAVSVVAVPIVSLFTPKLPQETINNAFEITE